MTLTSSSAPATPAAPAAAGAEPAAVPGFGVVPGFSAVARCVGDVTAFARDIWGRRPLLVPAGSAGFDDLLSPADVDDLLGGRALRLPFFRLVQGGTSIPTGRYTRTANAGNRRLDDLPDSAKVAALFADGATIVLPALHRVHPPLGEFCRELAAELGSQTQANVYVSPPGAQGFTAHHDTHDVFVLQIDGAKHWTVREPIVELPLAAQPSSALDPGEAASSPVALDVELRPGDVLYLPRGWLHEAATAGSRSVHLTVGLLQTTWHDVLADAVALAAESLPLRAALPLRGHDRDDLEAFRSAALAWLRDVDVDRLAGLVAARRGRAVPPEPVGVLAQERAVRNLHADTVVRPRAGLGWEVADADGRTTVRVGVTTVSVPGYAGAALRRVLSGPATPAGLGLDDADGVVLVRRLLREGLVLPGG